MTPAARRLGLLVIAGALAAGIAWVGRRRTGDGSGPAEPETYRCETCGTTYRVSGADRHRVYWREGAPESEPVLGDRCVECDAPLPAGREVAAL